MVIMCEVNSQLRGQNARQSLSLRHFSGGQDQCHGSTSRLAEVITLHAGVQFPHWVREVGVIWCVITAAGVYPHYNQTMPSLSNVASENGVKMVHVCEITSD